MELDARHLRVVCTIAATGSLTKAAAQLGLSQPALTAQLRRIEAVLGGPLFVRSRQGTTATMLGEFIVAKARPVLTVIDGIRDEAIDHHGFTEKQRPLRYVATPGPLRVGMISALEELWPGGLVVLRTESHVATATELIMDGQQDLAAVVTYVQGEPAVADCARRLIVAEDPVFALVAAHHPVASRPSVSLADLRDEFWALPVCRGSGLVEAFTEACSQAGFTARIRHQVDAGGARELIAAGDAVSLGQATYPSMDNIVAVPLHDEPLHTRQTLVWRENSAVAPLMTKIARQAREVYGRAVDRSPHYVNWLARHRVG